MGDDVYVNMYFSSVYEGDGLKMSIRANLPSDDQVSVRINTNTRGRTVRFRIPDWVAGEVAVTGGIAAEEGGYLVFGDLTAGTILNFTFPMEVKVYDLPDNPHMIAFKYGPVVLSCGLGVSNPDREEGAGILVRASQADKSVNPVILVDTGSVREWMDNVAQNLQRMENDKEGQVQFCLNNTNRGELIYTPHYRRHGQRYGLYMTFAVRDSREPERLSGRIFPRHCTHQSEVGDSQEPGRLSGQGEAEIVLDSVTVFDNNNSELSHHLQYSGNDGAAVGSFRGRTYRYSCGWFGYDLAIAGPDKNLVQYLNTTYTTADSGRAFDIYINDRLFVREKIVNQEAEADPDGFYTRRRQIPEELLREGRTGVGSQAGKPVITVKIQATNGPAGGLYGISVTGQVRKD